MSKFALFFMLVYLGGFISAFATNGATAFLLYQAVYMINAEERWWYHQVPDFRYSFYTSILMLAVLFFQYNKLTSITRWRDLPVLKWILLFLLLHLFDFSCFFFGLLSIDLFSIILSCFLLLLFTIGIIGLDVSKFE